MRQFKGIVLRSSPLNPYSGYIFDEQKGKMHVKQHQRQNNSLFHAGMIIVYNAHWKNDKGTLFDINLEYMPLEWARQDLEFLHLVLKVCDWYLPFGAQEQEIFLILCQLMYSSGKLETMQLKKIVLVKFFLLLGVWLTDSKQDDIFFARLLSAPFSVILENKIIMDETCIHKWLLACMQGNYLNDSIKRFLLRSGHG